VTGLQSAVLEWAAEAQIICGLSWAEKTRRY
jgi:hypothetical protein